jgi:STE24 endopeptidase
MTFARRGLLLLCFLGIACLVHRYCLAQQTPTQPATAQPAQAPAQSAYTLPPDKLAKAIALNRLRNILDIVGGLWGIAVLWLLLALRGAAGIESWVHRVCGRRWLQGLLFFAVFVIVLDLANLPLDIFGHHVSRAYGIGIQGWGGWLGDRAKGARPYAGVGRPVLLLFNGIVRRWPRRYWVGAWIVTLPLMVLGLFVAPLLEPIFNKYEPLVKESPRAGGQAGNGCRPHRNSHPAGAHVPDEGQ